MGYKAIVKLLKQTEENEKSFEPRTQYFKLMFHEEFQNGEYASDNANLREHDNNLSAERYL